MALLFLSRPAHLESLRWWHSPAVVAVSWSHTQRVEAIDLIYEERSMSRGRCVERAVAATNRVNRFIREDVYDARTRNAAQEAISAIADERALTQGMSSEVTALLSAEQRRLLSQMRPGPAIH